MGCPRQEIPAVRIAIDVIQNYRCEISKNRVETANVRGCCSAEGKITGAAIGMR